MKKYYDYDANKINVINFKLPYKSCVENNSNNKKKLMISRLIARKSKRAFIKVFDKL